MPSNVSWSMGGEPARLAEVADRAGRDPPVKALHRIADRALLAVPRQHPGLQRQVEQPLADRGELAGEVGELTLVRYGAAGGQRVAGADDLEFFAVNAHRAGRVAWSVDDLELDVRHLEAAAVGHLDLRVLAVVHQA